MDDESTPGRPDVWKQTLPSDNGIKGNEIGFLEVFMLRNIG
jgi:hypothetical protein